MTERDRQRKTSEANEGDSKISSERQSLTGGECTAGELVSKCWSISGMVCGVI